MSMSTKTVLLALLVLPGVAVAESEPSAKAPRTGAAHSEIHAQAGIAASAHPIRCRLYFGCARIAPAASETAHPMPEQ